MGAQMLQAIEEVIFTSPEDSMMITLCDGKMMELFGDGFLQSRADDGSISESQVGAS